MSELFYARATDPDTSHIAAANLNHFNMKPAEQVIYRILLNEIMTDEVLVNKYHDYCQALALPKLMRSASAIRTLRVKMYRDGVLRCTGVGKSSSGNPARLWTAKEL